MSHNQLQAIRHRFVSLINQHCYIRLTNYTKLQRAFIGIYEMKEKSKVLAKVIVFLHSVLVLVLQSWKLLILASRAALNQAI